ncbi:hypothetical protein [Methanonatronarchaeum sp. AMET-Sl]|uniref:NOP5/NOP56 family protein n=1 Tax=Methanonatronarchaeum sp. AMET-Sl TaxID=3037654 RepID=UPI00244E593B|nr:hypothetical protein [Methanonatronarchaeum sp. AMET-Sl]WGI16863.1 hypothetical protein QEN48_05035 [Methanonatronarchaeum sp. AMET-Sl]
MYFIETWFGVFIIDDELNVVDSRLYPKNPEAIVESIKKNKNGYIESYEAKPAPPELEKEFRLELWPQYEEGYSDLLHEVSHRLSEEQVDQSLLERGEDVIRAVETMDKLDKSINLLAESIKEWTHAQKQTNYDSGEKIAEKIVEQQLTPNDFTNKDSYQQIDNVSKQLIELQKTRDKTKNYLENEMQNFAPNITEVCGPIIGARLISLAGGLKKLALMPSGTIQVLGAEKALFRHLKNGSEPPKHGVIFQHDLIKNTHWSKRGPLARTLASKTALASRIDYFSGENKSEKLLKDLEKRRKEVLNK